MKSYSSTRMGITRRLQELWALYQGKRGKAESQARAVMKDMDVVADRLATYTHLKPQDRTVLDIGPGQERGHMYWLATSDNVVGIDLDVAPEGWDPRLYVRQLRNNGLLRVVKTVGRKALGIDRQFRRALARELDVDHLPELDIQEMDATHMTFPNEYFDLVFSQSVFEHISDAAAALAEVQRVTKPGGASFIGIHLYTSDSGCHDPRLLYGRRGDLPYWPHLRPQFKAVAQPNAYLNKLRLEEWRALVEAKLPGARLVCERDTDVALTTALQDLRATHELDEYSDEELMTSSLQVIWQKPNDEATQNSGEE